MIKYITCGKLELVAFNTELNCFSWTEKWDNPSSPVFILKSDHLLI